jgi:phospholipase C
MAKIDPIKHVIVLMSENHSFDQMLGCMKEVYPQLEGVDPKALSTNPDYPNAANLIAQAETNETSIAIDPMHENVNVLQQINSNCSGFVEDFARSYPTSTPAERALIMGYYPRGCLAVLHNLAESFMICDHWFSSMPGPTWQNRFFVHSGTSMGHVKMPNGVFDKNWHVYDQTTVYDLLSKSKIPWKIYHDGPPQSLVMLHQLEHALNYHDMSAFYTDVQGPEADFPAYVFIEPAYSGSHQNDQHPPTDLMRGELLLAEVYNAIRKNSALWNSTLFIYLYDEHGGFYDHMVPPAAVAPDDNTDEYAFNQYGVRVPALLISPWVKKGVLSTVFDHTSILKYLSDKWGLGAWGLDALGKRTAAAATFASSLLELDEARTDTPEAIQDRLVGPATVTADPDSLNEHQKALVSFSHFLESKMRSVEDMAAVGSRSMRTLSGARSQLAVAADRFSLFIQHTKDGLLDKTGPAQAKSASAS